MELSLADLICVRDFGADCERRRPGILILGQADQVPPARGFVWDFRGEGCGVPLDFTRDITTHLDLDFLRRRLANYPNQQLVSMLLEGVRFQADVELQAVFNWHLVSLVNGYGSVDKELRRLREKGWYDFFAELPFFPIYLNGQGAVARKLEPDRCRRSTEGGGPRRACFDSSGLQAWSLNDASKVFHIPQHFRADDRPEMQEWLRRRGLPPTEEMLEALKLVRSRSKQGPEPKPTLVMIMHDLVVLRHAAQRMGEPVYLFGDDVKDYFNQLALAPEELWKCGIVFLGSDERGDPQLPTSTRDADGNFLIFVSELRMGFGLHPNSNIAQQFSEALNALFREDMDAVEDPLLEADPRPSAQEWLSERRALEAKVGGHQRRLYFVHMYTDDNVIGVVGVDRALRALRCWHSLTSSVGLIMAIPLKRSIGTWMPWLGALLFAGLGLIVIPRAKLARACTSLREALQARLDFSQYRALVGLLEHFRCVNRQPKRVMHGLYAPHARGGESEDGPSTIVRPNFFMTQQLLRWLNGLVAASAGVAITRALRRCQMPAPRTLTFVASADAATDSEPPGIGGFMHGFYWYMAVGVADLEWLHISVLELLATCFNAIVFHRIVGERGRLQLQSDALATPHVLTRDSAHSPAMLSALRRVLDSPAYLAAAEQADVEQIFGAANIAADAVSRALWPRFFALCRQLRVHPVRLDVPTEAALIYSHVLADARARGVRVRRSNAVRKEALPEGYQRFLTEEEMMLGRHVETTEEADAVMGQRLADALAAARARPPAPQQRGTVRAVEAVSAHGAAEAGSTEPLWPGAPTHYRHCAKALQQRRPETAAVPPPPSSLMQALQAGRAARERTAVAAQLRPASRHAVSPSFAASTSASSSAQAQAAAPRRSSGANASRAPQPSHGRLRAATAGGLVLPVPVHGPHARGRRVAHPARLEAQNALARERGERLAGVGASAEKVQRSVDQIEAMDAMAEHGAASRTLDKDDLHWEFWERFCKKNEWNPIVTNEDTARQPGVLQDKLSLFVLWVYPQLRGRGGRAAELSAKPDTAMGYGLSMLRVFGRKLSNVPSAKSLKAVVAGLMRNYFNAYGAKKLGARRREPMKREMWVRIESIPENTHLPQRRQPWSPQSNQRDRTMLRMGRVLWRTGHRVGEVCDSPDGEVRYFTRASVTYRIAGVVVMDPTAEQLRLLRVGDVILLESPASKPDQFGIEHCPFPSVLPYSDDPLSAARAIVDIELESPCRGSARESRPLFADQFGRPLTYSAVNSWLHQVLAHLLGERAASALSWHSVRIGLACALRAVGCPPDVIQLICRWACEESLRLYARLDVNTNVEWTDKAQHATFDAYQVANLPELDHGDQYAEYVDQLEEGGERREDVMRAGGRSPQKRSRATASSTATPAVAAEPESEPESEPEDLVMVPRSVWPAYVCDEFEGKGWLARVLRRKRGWIRLQFVHACDEEGTPHGGDAYELPASLLKELPVGYQRFLTNEERMLGRHVETTEEADAVHHDHPPWSPSDHPQPMRLISPPLPLPTFTENARVLSGGPVWDCLRPAPRSAAEVVGMMCFRRAGPAREWNIYTRVSPEQARLLQERGFTVADPRGFTEADPARSA
jgi:hypothetical protein